MSRLMKIIPRAPAALRSRLSRLFKTPRPFGWEVGSARLEYEEFERGRKLSATRYGDWEYSGRCTDF